MLLLTSTIGFPNTSAALSWVFDILEGKANAVNEVVAAAAGDDEFVEVNEAA